MSETPEWSVISLPDGRIEMTISSGGERMVARLTPSDAQQIGRSLARHSYRPTNGTRYWRCHREHCDWGAHVFPADEALIAEAHAAEHAAGDYLIGHDESSTR